jgi:hypothetical protein
MKQEYTSEKTSRKQIPKLFRKIKLTGVNLDIGGGKYDLVQETYGHEFTNLVYDPFNRSETHNQEVMEKAILGVNSVWKFYIWQHGIAIMFIFQFMKVMEQELVKLQPRAIKGIKKRVTIFKCLITFLERYL